MDKYIFHKKKALDRKTCQNIIQFLERSNLIENTRGYDYIDANLTWTEYKPIGKVLIPYIQEYTEKHQFLKKGAAGGMVNLFPGFMIKRFSPGKFYDCKRFANPKEGEHMEHGPNDYDCTRVLAWMFYLNDIKYKGGTCWPQQNFISKPRAGDLYIWPAGWTHSHYGIPAPKENKYFMSGWCVLSK
tara:strand:- start:59 stop:616 length:558 start_codon:yes stop_codon:yes gene_type:complete